MTTIHLYIITILSKIFNFNIFNDNSKSFIIRKIFYFLNWNFFTKNNIKYKKYDIWDYTYWTPQIKFDHCWYTLKIWKYCSIAENVKIFLWWNHRVDRITTYPFPLVMNKHLNLKYNVWNWDVSIWHDVWIWSDVTIMSWVIIWNGAVIANWSIVTKAVQPYSIVWWIPAKEIKKRFEETQILKLLNNPRREKWIEDIEHTILDLLRNP